MLCLRCKASVKQFITFKLFKDFPSADLLKQFLFFAEILPTPKFNWASWTQNRISDLELRGDALSYCQLTVGELSRLSWRCRILFLTWQHLTGPREPGEDLGVRRMTDSERTWESEGRRCKAEEKCTVFRCKLRRIVSTEGEGWRSLSSVTGGTACVVLMCWRVIGDAGGEVRSILWKSESREIYGKEEVVGKCTRRPEEWNQWKHHDIVSRSIWPTFSHFLWLCTCQAP